MKYNYRLVIKKDTAINWRLTTYIPLDGEPCYDTTNKLLKMGDGVNLFDDLAHSINRPSVETFLLTGATLPPV